MNVQVKLMEATPLTGGLLFSMQSPPRPRRTDLKMPERDTGNFRGNGPRKRSNDGGGRPPNVRHSAKRKGQASYGKNKGKKR